MLSRVTRLLVGLVLYGFGCAVTVAAGLGVDPWTVFAQGVSRVSGIGLGWITNLIGLGVLLLWIPLRQKPGVGTVANILLVGTSLQLALGVLPHPQAFWAQALMLVTGVVLVAVGSGLYIGAHFGPGPRDGLMTGLNARFGWPIWACRLTVEGSVLILGWLLGGTVGIGTVVFALGIGPLVHVALPLLASRRPGTQKPRVARV
ncbi:YitT family protein [Microbacterium sp. NPDC090007]|uniref:membrane protein YczE n=1 Tax=Microbacterium sp. NPDC090007 TaxID=3364204 RepID=UPI0038265457